VTEREEEAGGLRLAGLVDGQRRTWPLRGDRLRLGRSSRNEVAIADATVSKEHAEIARAGAAWVVRDLGSRNGTFVNGVEAREPVALHDGDSLTLGSLELRVERAGTEPPLYSPASGVSSSLRLRAREVLARPTPGGGEGSRLVGVLAEAGRMLVLPRPVHETCEEILRLVEKAVPARRLVLLLREDPDRPPVQIAVRHQGVPTREPLALSNTILRAVLDDCTSVVTTDAANDPRFAGQHSVILQAIHSAMAVPLFDDERVLGVLYADTTDPRVHYGEELLEVLTVLANMAAVKITNARLLETEQARLRMVQELATAARIQRALLPEPPEVEGWQCAIRLETCLEVGGDLYDLHRRPDGTLVFTLGDVSGKGMGAALLMSSAQSSARVLYDACDDPAELVRRLHAVLRRSTEVGQFLTLFVGYLDPATGSLRYCNAGHNPPILVVGGTTRTLAATGVPVAMIDGVPWTTECVTLEPGALLALYSDGLTEALVGTEFFGDERLMAGVRARAGSPELEEVAEGLLGEVTGFLSGAPREDDMTLLLVRRAPTG
jgi:serine phosphatase RsbU (regulator of sigma subunit)